MTYGQTEQKRCSDASERPAPMSDPVAAGEGVSRSPVDPRWTGIAEVLVTGLGGAVVWERDSVVLQLPDHPRDGRIADLDGLRLCLGRIGMPVVFDSSRVILPDVNLVDFLKNLVEAGLMVDAASPAA